MLPRRNNVGDRAWPSVHSYGALPRKRDQHRSWSVQLATLKAEEPHEQVELCGLAEASCSVA
eukprot:5171446-Heterocapsa_arctica.AAC.1